MIEDVLAVKDVRTHCPLCGRSFQRVASNTEHIFPKWLQHHHDLWTSRLTIPNFTGKLYKSVTIRICTTCNNKRFGQRETLISRLVRAPDPYAAAINCEPGQWALWLGKISWLLCRKSHSVDDFRTRNEPKAQRVLPEELLAGTLYLGMFERAFAMNKDMASCFADDPPYPPLYGAPFSIYRFRIDTRDNRFGAFDFVDNPAALGIAFRSNNLGLICLFDGGLHRRFRSHFYQYLEVEMLHPMQFNEVIARVFYDQTVMDARAFQVTYYWNRPLKAVIAQNHTPRFYDPYLQENNDPERYADFLGKYTFADPREMLSEDGRAFTMLKDLDGTFLRYPITEAEMEAARRDPNRVVHAVDRERRSKPPLD